MTIMERSAYKFWHGKELPREIAYLYMDIGDSEWQITTFKEILEKKRVKQRTHLEGIRQSEILTPCFVWTFYNSGFPYYGWWLYIRTLKKSYALNFRNENRKMQKRAMQLFPCGFLPFVDNLEKWMIMFAKIYNYPTKKRNKQGMAKAWVKINGNKLIDIIKIDSDE